MNILTSFLAYKNQAQILHWQTQSYSEHEAFGDFYSEFDSLIDSFIESFMGKYGRIVSDSTFTFSLKNYEDFAPMLFLDAVSNYLIVSLPVMLDKNKDTDLLNIRDEMLALVNKTKYLLSLK